MSSITGVSSPNTLTQIVTVGGVTTTTTQTTTVAPTITDLGVPYVQSTAGLPSPSAPGDSEALIALILSKIQEAVGQSRNNQTLTDAQRTLGVLNGIQAAIADYAAASATIANARVTIQNLKNEKQSNATQISNLYQQLTGDPNATSISGVTADVSGAHGVYGVFLAKKDVYDSALTSFNTAQTNLETANGQQAVDERAASDYKSTALTVTLSGLYNALTKIGNGTATASDNQTISTALGSSNTGTLATALRTYQGLAAKDQAAYWSSTMVPLLGTLASVRDATVITDMNAAVNLLSTSGNGMASSQLGVYKGKIDTINSLKNDPVNGYQAKINAATSTRDSAKNSLINAERDLAPYLDYASTNGGNITFTSSAGGSYVFDFTNISPPPTQNNPGLVKALLDPIKTLTDRNRQIGDENTPGTDIYNKDQARLQGIQFLANALAALSAAVSTSSSIDTGDNKDTRLQTQSYDNIARDERDRLESNDTDVQDSIAENNKEAAILHRIRELLQQAPVNTASRLAGGIVDVLFTLQQFGGEGGQPDTTETLGGRGSRVRVLA